MKAIPPGCLIVACQARADNPLHGPVHMAAMARAAADGGAAAIRANGPDDIAAIRAVVALPIIGILQRLEDGVPVYITPDFEAARACAVAGADMIALDATMRTRRGDPPDRLIARIKAELGLPVVADVATVQEGVAAAGWGADYVATTLSGYTVDTEARRHNGPDLALVSALAARVEVPVVAEGRYDTPAQVARAFDHGAHAVVVGTAITNPREITKRFAAARWKI
jgi:N-acylglucosamine-6-phosphate 2-epimerase